MINVLIGVQARSTSTRLPKKSVAILDTQTITDHVLAACTSAADHVVRQKTKNPINAIVALLVPQADPLKDLFRHKIDVVEGPEDDVLARYMLAVERFNPDYIVRVTGDCPLISAPLISKHILCAVFDKLDYCSNVPDGARTYIDGLDCEVLSAPLMGWLDENAETKEDREHVTSYARSHTPQWAKIGSIMGYIDLSDIKLSVDTVEDLERVRENRALVNDKINVVKKRGHFLYRF